MTEHTDAIERTRVDVLHVTECGSGGVTRAIEQIIADVPEAEHAVLAPEGAVRVPSGVQTWDLPLTFTNRVLTIRKAVAALQPRVIHAHSSWAGVYSRIQPLGVPVIYEPHCYSFADVTRPKPVRAGLWAAERVLTPHSDAILTLSSYEDRAAKQLGARRIDRVVNSATITAPRGQAVDLTHPLVVTAGRIAAQKDPYLYAAIAEATAKLDPRIRFAWIGDGDKTAKRRLEAAGVEVTGWIQDDNDLANLIGSAALYLHTAAYEGFPLSILDAAACAVPVLARAIPALSDVSIPTFDAESGTPADAANRVVALVTPGAERDKAIEQVAELDQQMSKANRRTSMLNAYRPYVPRLSD